MFVRTPVTQLRRICVKVSLEKWCISKQLHIRKHSYLDHSYPGGDYVVPNVLSPRDQYVVSRPENTVPHTSQIFLFFLFFFFYNGIISIGTTDSI